MSKILQQEIITTELIAEEGKNTICDNHSVIADPKFFEMLRGLYVDDDRPGIIQHADEIKIRFKNLVFVLQTEKL